uniref:Uncharacterized protein n=1 Tax=Romanomermis culicivorax TaxID=13658 RepID=A0A915KAJ1_ROMCU
MISEAAATVPKYSKLDSLDVERPEDGCRRCSSYLICGGGAPEMEVACRLREMANSVAGVDSYCWRAYADALEIIPYTLTENAGLNPIATVTELRARHAAGEKAAGINVRKLYNATILLDVPKI